jgi:hypothetical protein
MPKFADPDKPEFCEECGAHMWLSTVSGNIIRTCECYNKALRAQHKKKRRDEAIKICKKCRYSGYDGTCSSTEQFVAIMIRLKGVMCRDYVSEDAITKPRRTR